MSNLPPLPKAEWSGLVNEGGPWRASADGRMLESDDFHHDATLCIGGDFGDDATRKAYADELARRLNRPQAVTPGA